MFKKHCLSNRKGIIDLTDHIIGDQKCNKPITLLNVHLKINQ